MRLDVERIEAGYGAKTVVADASLGVAEREVVAVIGPNGAGKTTLLKAIFGILPVKRGAVRWNEKDITRRRPAENVRDGISFSPQGAPVYKSLTVADNLAIAGSPVRDKRRVRANTARVLELFPILERRRAQRAGFLSGGERQMLAIGAALIPSPRLIILDEPSGGLAPIVVETMFATVRRIVDEFGTAVLLVEQNLQQAFAIADRAYVMAGGRTIASGTPDELERNPDFQDQYFGGGASPAGAKTAREPATS